MADSATNVQEEAEGRGRAKDDIVSRRESLLETLVDSVAKVGSIGSIGIVEN